MSEKELDDADVHAALQHVRGEAMPERVRPEFVVKAALASRLVESRSCGRVGQVGHGSATGEQPPLAAVGLPNLPQHLHDRFGQWERPLLVSLADHAENHLLGVNRRDRQCNRLPDSQSIRVDDREAAAIDRLFQRRDQAAAILITADVGQAFLAWLANFFLVNNAQS